MLAIAAALLLIAPIRKGDLAGYDDAVYAHIAKAIVKSGDWVNVQSNGFAALEHPPGFVWMQAALFSLVGFSDFLAKLPSALCGAGTVLLVYWLARRIWNDAGAAAVAMFVMLATPYFIKYTSHGMTDVPFAFLFTAAICSWIMAKERPVWYASVAFFAAYALLTRGIVGSVVLATLGIDLAFSKRPNKPFAIAVLAGAAIPLAVWYAHLYRLHGEFFWLVQSTFLKTKLAGDSPGTLRAFTGVFEYAWMLAQSYWPWLPFLVVGIWSSFRDRRFRLLIIWIAAMYVACAVAGSRVLRYLLPAYPAFSIFVAGGLMRLIPRERIDTGLRWLVPAALVASLGIALFPPVSMHAAEIRPIAEAVRNITNEGERFVFYDAGQPRFDETGQIQWYGDRTMWILTDAAAFERALAEPISRVWIVDAATYAQHFAVKPHSVAARSGHLVLVRLT